MRKRSLFVILLMPVAWADVKEDPVGLVLNAGGGKILRANTETPLAARAGDLLFSGDGIRTESAAASFLFCPSKAIETLSQAGEVRLDAHQLKVKTGKISEQAARACTLPQALRVAIASQQHYGVSMTRGATTGDVPPVPRNQLAADVLAELAPLEAALAADPNDQGARVAIAAVFEKHALTSNALEVYNKLREAWPDAVWVKTKMFELQEAQAEQAAAKASAGLSGKTYALLVGISNYKKSELSLQFAESDASVFSRLLATPRLGGLPPDSILLLTDAKATTAAVRNGFQDFLKRRAGKNDTVILLIAGHGTVETPGNKNAYILTYDADPQDLNSTALPMAELQSLFAEQLKNVGRVILFVDVCKAGTIGTIHNTSVNSDVQKLGDAEGDLFGLAASRPKEVSLEGPEFGGGHGAFSYFVIKGLDGAADENKDGVVDANELIKYVSDQVASATGNKQHPREFGTYDNAMRLSDVKKPGINIALAPFFYDSERDGRVLVAGPYVPPQNTGDAAELDRFQSALNAGRLLPGEPQSAFDSLRLLRTSAQYTEYQNRLRVALENRAQEVLLRYLAGDQNPQTQQDFDQGARLMQAARTLTVESLYLEGREDFFQGRALLFDKNYPSAATLLEQAVRIDPGSAYGYNALGIAYLQQAQFDKAIAAFHDAARRAQHWSYPLHNQALAYMETGDYASAVRSYKEAMRLAPQYSYLPYNLGLVYQRLNQRKDAAAAYEKAIALSPNSGEPYNALGTLRSSEGKRAEAERLYREALQKNPGLTSARQNLALLLSADKNRRAEAIDLWRANLTQTPNYLPSMLSLAETLAEAGDNRAAIEQYRAVLALKPGYTGARIALAQVLGKSGDSEGALVELREASKADPQNFALLEQIGDLESARGRIAEARAAYTAAAAVQDRSARKRVNQKLKSLESRPGQP